MRIAYITPGFGPCGGMRVVAEHVNRLAARGHEMFVLMPRFNRTPRWIEVNATMGPIIAARGGKPFDAVVATGYNTVAASLRVPGRNHLWFVQMAEWAFYQKGGYKRDAAMQAYELATKQGLCVVTIAQWVYEEMKQRWGIDAEIIGNGVNQEHFYVPDGVEKAKAIMVEGDCRNAAKDVDHLTWRAAIELKEEYGVELWGYSAIGNPYTSHFDKFVLVPDVDTMRDMYARSLFLLKASRYDARACAPVEAMCCGTPTVRALIRGDDDLIHGRNCLRSGYDYERFIAHARRLMTDRLLLENLRQNCLVYADRRLRWEDKIDQLEGIYRQ